MPTVFNLLQFCAHTVVPPSRPLGAALGLTLALGSWSLEAIAAPPLSPESAPRATSAEEPPPEPARTVRDDSYRALLAVSYVAAPFLAIGVGHSLAELEADDSVAGLGATTMFLMPAAVHMAHGKLAHGPISFLGLAASTAVGVLVGGFTGYQIDRADCDPDEDSEGCDFAGFTGLVVGTLVGGVTAYTGFAVYDVMENGAREPGARRHADRASLQLWMRPLPGARAEREEATAPFGGVQLGATLQM